MGGPSKFRVLNRDLSRSKVAEGDHLGVFEPGTAGKIEETAGNRTGGLCEPPEMLEPHRSFL